MAQNRLSTWFIDLFDWLRKTPMVLIWLVIGCLLFGIVIIVVPSLVSLYLPDHTGEIATSNDDGTDLWGIRYSTNLENLQAFESRALSPFNKPALGRSFDVCMNIPSSTTKVVVVGISTKSTQSFRRLRRQDTTPTTNANGTFFLDVVLQALYPPQYSGVVQRQKLFRKQVLAKFLDPRRFPLPTPLEDGRIINLEVQLASLIQYFNLPVSTTDATSSTSTTTTTTLSDSTTTTATATLTTTTTTATLITTTTTTPLTTTSTTTPTTTTTALQNPCATGKYWSTTGITLLDSTKISSASGVYVDSANNLYVADETPSELIWKLLNNSVNPTSIAGRLNMNTAADTDLWNPQSAYIDRNGNLYASDLHNSRVQKFIGGSSHGITIAGVAGSSGTPLSNLNLPRYFAFDSTDANMYIADSGNNRVLRFSTASTSGTNGFLAAGVTGGGGNVNTLLNGPFGIDYLPSVSTDLFITNSGGHSVIRWTPGAFSGTFVAGTPGVSGSTPTTLNSPCGIKIDNYLNIYVVDRLNSRIQLFCAGSQTGITVAGAGSPTNGPQGLNEPRGIAFDAAMNMYIGDYGNSRVQKFLKL